MSSELKVNTINEYTSANGVTIDGVLIKDGEVDGVDVSAITQGITDFDAWSMNANHTTADVIPGSKFSRSIGTLQGGYKGTGMSVNSTTGVWTFPTTGLWFVQAAVIFVMGSSDRFVEITTSSSNDNFSTEDKITATEGAGNNTSNTAGGSVLATLILDITDTSNDKIKFNCGSFSSGTYARGSTSHDFSKFTFIRLGDT